MKNDTNKIKWNSSSATYRQEKGLYPLSNPPCKNCNCTKSIKYGISPCPFLDQRSE